MGSKFSEIKQKNEKYKNIEKTLENKKKNMLNGI